MISQVNVNQLCEDNELAFFRADVCLGSPGYDAALACAFLGASERGFVGGRLEEYLNDEQTARIDEIAVAVHDACARVEKACGPNQVADPFEYLLDLKRTPLIPY